MAEPKETKKKTTKESLKKARHHEQGYYKEKLKRAVHPPKKDAKRKAFEDNSDLQKLYLYVIVVENSVTDSMIQLLQEMGSSAQFIHSGRGTAPSDVLSLLSAVDDRKAVINAFIGEDKLPALREELDSFFRESRANRGIAFAIPLSSIQGIRMYKYLTQTI